MRLFFWLMVVFASGVALYDPLGISWEYKRWFLVLHVPVAIWIVADSLLPFIYPHSRYFLRQMHTRSGFKSFSGLALLIFFLLSLISGIYLMFVGDRGEIVGRIFAFVHLYISFVIVLFFLLHARKVFAFALLATLIVSPQSIEASSTDQAIKRGEKLFFATGKTDIEGLDMGKASCGSCHVDGFNKNTKKLFEVAVDPYKDATLAHKTIKNFFAHDFVEDYIEAILEQGGSVQNPKNPSQKIIEAMGEMHLYIRSAKNLPYFSNWIRLDENITHYEQKEWLSSANCKSCHEDAYKDWANSNHRLMGGSNPYYMVLEDLAAKIEGEGFRFWCMGCHSPTQITTGARETNRKNLMFDQDGKYLVDRLKDINKEPEEGTSCLFCHRITDHDDIGNAGYTINLRDRENYLLEERGYLLGYIHDQSINSKPKAHIDSYSKNLYKDPKYCSSCHTEFSPGKGVMIVETYKEWEESPFNKGLDNPETKTCIDCHMHKNPSELDTKVVGKSTSGGATKQNLRTHHFVGSNHFLVGLRSKEHEKMTIDLLKTSAKLLISSSDGGFAVEVQNVGAGHHLPTGVADFRELWLEVVAVDNSGKVVAKSGFLVENEVEPEAKMFKKVFGDKDGKPVGLAFWRYEKLISDTRIPAGKSRIEQFKFDKNPAYPVTITAKLNFRIYPDWVTKEVQKTYKDLPTPPVVELNKITKVLE